MGLEDPKVGLGDLRESLNWVWGIPKDPKVGVGDPKMGLGDPKVGLEDPRGSQIGGLRDPKGL